MPILSPHTPFLRSLGGLILCRGLDGLKLVAETGENLHRHNTIWVINVSCPCPDARVSGLREEMLGLQILLSKAQAGTARAMQLFIHPGTKIITHTNMVHVEN